MTQQEVKMKILEAFQCDGFSLLECVKGRLRRADNVELTGHQAISRRGTLYLCQDQKVSSVARYTCCCELSCILPCVEKARRIQPSS